MKNIKNIAFNIFTSIILTLIIFLLFKSGFIKNIIGFNIDPFIDLHINYIPWFECYRKELSDEICKSVHINYGMIFLKIPFNPTLKLFYINYLPYINILLLVSTITFLLNPKNIVEYFTLIIIVLNPATLIPLYNFNFEIFIFLMFVIIGVNRIYLINWILFLYCFLLKLYPLISGVFIFIENKKRSLNFFIILIISLIAVAFYFIFIDVKQYSSASQYYFPISDVLVSGGKPGYWHLFGLNTIPKILKYFEFNYIFSIVLVYSIFFYLLYKLIKSSYINRLTNNEDFFTYRWKLFLLGGNVLLLSYIIYSNWIHRELFLILLIPQFLILNFKEKRFLNIVTSFLVFRYLFLFIYAPSNLDSYYIIDNKRYFSNFFLIAASFKGILDFILMSFIGSIIIKMNFSIIKKFLISFKS